MINKSLLNNKCEWTQGYVTAVCSLIYLEGGVHTIIKELYHSGIGCTTLKDLKIKGVQKHELDILKKYWKQLQTK